MKPKILRMGAPFLLAVVLILILNIIFNTSSAAPGQAAALSGAGFLAVNQNPQAASPAALSWKIQTVDSAWNVGKYSSLALDAAGNPRISYYDESRGDLVYAAHTGMVWLTQTVDSVGDLGQYTSLALNNAGLPRISYYGTKGSDQWNLYFASFNGSSWAVATVDNSSAHVGSYSSLALTSGDAGRISYVDKDAGPVLKYAFFKSGAWNPDVIGPYNYGVFGPTSLVLDWNSRAHILYGVSSGDFPALHRIYYNGSSWVDEIVDDSVPPGSDGVGGHSSLAMEPNGRPHVSYCQYDKLGYCAGLRYAFRSGSTWISTTVDSGSNVGAYTSLAMDAENHPHISYYDDGHLSYAYFNGSSWMTQTVDSSASGVGQFTSLELDAFGQPHISYYDEINGDLKYAVGHSSCTSLDSLTIDGPHGVATDTLYAFTASISPTNATPPFLYTWQATDHLQTMIFTDTTSLSLSYSWANPGVKVITVNAQNCANTVTATHSLATSAIPLVDVPLEAIRLAARHLEDTRGSDAAPGWWEASLGSDVRPLYRPDVAGVAYYEFPVMIPTIQREGSSPATLASGQSAGFIIVSAGEHDYPIAHWSSVLAPPSVRMEQQAALEGELAVKFYKLDALAYAAENEAGEKVASLGSQLFKITGMDPDWVENPPEADFSEWVPSIALTDDLMADQITGTFAVTGPPPPASLQVSAWGSWDELKAGYSESYGVLAEVARQHASELWLATKSQSQYGQPLYKGQTYLLAALWPTPTVSLSGPGVGFIQTNLLPRAGLGPLLQIKVVDSSLGEIVPFTVELGYSNGITEQVGFIILGPYQVFLPLAGRETDPMAPSLPPVPSKTPSFLPAGSSAGPASPGNPSRVQDTSWHYYYAGTDADQCWYRQIPKGESPNTSGCVSGCGATGWAMLFGWVDNQAVPTSGNEYWAGRWGLYRTITGFDAIAPKTWGNSLVKDMIWEIRNDIETWCWDSDSAPTLPWDMDQAHYFIDGRSAINLSAEYSNVGIGWDYIRDYAKDGIAYAGEGKNTPALVGTGWLSHYPLAYGYRWRHHVYCIIPSIEWGCTTTTERQFMVNMGWGEGNIEWVPSDIWYAGRVSPKSSWNNDVGVYRPTTGRWYYDFDHNANTDEGNKYWGGYNDLPAAGDFTRNKILGDVALYDPGSGTWRLDYKHDRTTDVQFTVSWADKNRLPVVLDYDRDGFMDDLGLFHPASGTWCFDPDHDNTWVCSTTSWGLADDLPMAGDFDRDGFADDLAVYRPSTGMWYYDYDHNKDTDTTSGPWGLAGDRPVAGDFDKDGYMDDVAIYRPSTSEWYYDYDHNGHPTNDQRGPWGMVGDLPIAGNFDTR